MTESFRAISKVAISTVNNGKNVNIIEAQNPTFIMKTNIHLIISPIMKL